MDIDIQKYKNLLKKHRIILLITTFILLTAIGILILTNNTIIIESEQENINYSFRGKTTVKDVLIKNDIVLKENDVVLPTLSTVLKDGDTITIKEAYAVRLIADHKVYTFNTTNTNVQDIIRETGITLQALDIVSPSLEATLNKEGEETISIVRVTEEFEETKQELKYKTETQKNNSLDKGINKTIQSGKNGEMLIKEKVVYHDDEEYSREVVEQEVVKEPVNEVKEIGTNTLIATSRGSKKFARTITVTATGYCPCSKCVGNHNGNITASGRASTAYRTVAASSSLSFGTNLFIPYFKNASNGGIFVVEDRGGSVSGNKIDIFFSNHQDALRFGRRTLKVYVLE
ncbi:MAG: G5 domain-containing protein [Eubacteriales bacterium]